MPKVTIREFDRTGSNEVSYLDYTVLVPGIKLAYTDATSEEVSLDGLYEDFKSFEKEYSKIVTQLKKAATPETTSEETGEDETESGSETETDNTTETTTTEDPYAKDYGIQAAIEFLKAGLSVQYVGVYNLTDKGIGLIKEKVENNKQEDDSVAITRIFREFEDRSKYDLRFIYLGGLNNTTYHNNACMSAITCAANRGDALAVIATPKDTKKSADIQRWIDTNLKNTLTGSIERKGVTFEKNANNENCGQYTALFTPTLKTSVVDINNNVVKTFTIDGAWNYLTTFAKNLKTYAPWYAAAGSLRGASSYDITPMIKYGEADIDLLQKREYSGDDKTTFATNLITEIRPYGNIIWGNRTMCPIDSTSTQLRAASFLNIRQLCITLKKTLYRAARRFTYEPNSDVLWVNFKSQITPLLEEMKANQGIRGYQLSKVSTNKKAVLAATIKIIPIEAVEDFDLTVELTDAIEVAE